jgi:cytochrome o ubiquinol oxidase subunit 2
MRSTSYRHFAKGYRRMAEGGALQLIWPWQAGVLDPQGPIGAAQRTILLDTTAIMLCVVVPVIVLTLVFAWWFRSGNQRAHHLPDWSYSGSIEVIVWSIPALIIMFLGGVAWISSHDLDPHRPIRSTVPSLDIEVVSLDWKWLFIYPAEGVASVNRLVVPAATPLRFHLTSASVMNSFFVPQLGSQIYTMARMATQLNLQADRPGTYPGLSAQFSGDGFSDMRFEVEALPPDSFKKWVTTTRAGSGTLDTTSYAQLAQQGTLAAPATYSAVMPRLFEAVVRGDAPASGTPHIGRPSVDISPRTGD